jgi:hypothetical protein
MCFSKRSAKVVVSALDGYNGTIFAYGQTGSGKTFTITGGAPRSDVLRGFAKCHRCRASRGFAIRAQTARYPSATGGYRDTGCNTPSRRCNAKDATQHVACARAEWTPRCRGQRLCAWQSGHGTKLPTDRHTSKQHASAHDELPRPCCQAAALCEDGASRCTVAVQRVAPQAHSWCDAGTEKYVDRGIIPRTISMLFNEFSKRTDHTFQVRNPISPTGPGATVVHCVCARGRTPDI